MALVVVILGKEEVISGRVEAQAERGVVSSLISISFFQLTGDEELMNRIWMPFIIIILVKQIRLLEAFFKREKNS